MDEEKKAFVTRIENLQKELGRLTIKSQTFTEMISHLRDRRENVERRKREIHYEVQDIQAEIRAWEAARKE